MRIFLFILVLFLWPGFWLLSQTKPCFPCYENPLRVESHKPLCDEFEGFSEEVILVLDRRKRSFDFFRTIRMLHEPSTASMLANWTFNNMGYDKKNFILDGDMQVPVAMGGGRMGFHTFVVIPKLRFRIFQNDPGVPFGPEGDRSLPVRTPSAMPGIAYYTTLPGLWYQDHDWAGLKKYLQNKFIGLYAYHHSNGQDGPEIDPTNPGVINEYNGNFSEEVVFDFIMGGRKQFITEQLNFNTKSNQRKINEGTMGKRLMLRVARRSELYWRLSYEWHPRTLSNQVFDSLGILPRHRMKLNMSYHIIPTLWDLVRDGENWCSAAPEQSFEKWRFTTELSYAIDREYYRGELDQLEKIAFFNLKRRLNLVLRAYYVIGRSQYSALFAQLAYLGSDQYNIYFNQSLFYFRLGLAFGFFNQPDDK